MEKKSILGYLNDETRAIAGCHSLASVEVSEAKILDLKKGFFKYSGDKEGYLDSLKDHRSSQEIVILLFLHLSICLSCFKRTPFVSHAVRMNKSECQWPRGKSRCKRCKRTKVQSQLFPNVFLPSNKRC